MRATKILNLSKVMSWVKSDQGSDLAEEILQGDKRGSVLGLVCPALRHQLVDVCGTMIRFLQSLSVFIQLLENLQCTQ